MSEGTSRALGKPSYQTKARIAICGRAIAVDLRDAKLPTEKRNPHMTLLYRSSGFRRDGPIISRVRQLRDDFLTTTVKAATIAFWLEPWGRRSDYIRGELEKFCHHVRAACKGVNSGDRPPHVELRPFSSARGGDEVGGGAPDRRVGAVSERKARFTGNPIAGWADDRKFYDEMVAEDGSARHAYSGVTAALGRIKARAPGRIVAFEAKSLRDFSGDNKLYHVPRMLTRAEAQKLHDGVRQRARTLQAFLCDHYSSDSKRPAYVRERAIPPSAARAIVKRNDELRLQRGVARGGAAELGKAWGFWYGPDVIRGPDGEFYVVEDNIGYVGGMGDLSVARRSLLNSFPEYGPCIDKGWPRPGSFYDALAADYHSAVGSDEAVVLLHYPRFMWSDKEEKRVKKILGKRDIFPVEIPVPNARTRGHYSLETTHDGVFLVQHRRRVRPGPTSRSRSRSRSRSPGRGHGQAKRHPKRENLGIVSRRRVGLVVVDAEIFDVDPAHRFVNNKAVLDEAKNWLETYKERIAAKNKKLSDINTASGGSDDQSCTEARSSLRGRHRARGRGGRRGRGRARGQKSNRATRIRARIQRLERNAGELEELLSAVQQTKRLGRAFRALKRFLKRRQREDYFDILNQGIPGLLGCYFAGQVKLINGPGFDFLGDKHLCMYVDCLTRFYLKEEPILKTIPTLSFGEGDTQTLLAAVFDDTKAQAHVVVKRVDGRGGDSVWVGPKVSREEFLSVRAAVEREPDAFLVQKFINLSQVDGQLTDLRVLASVRRDSVVVSRTPWGRGVPARESNGKVNISDKGFEFAVCTAAEPRDHNSQRCQ